jgi:Helicase conserved C-terminal domain
VTYRVSSASLNRAFALGETEATATEFLGQIALTGIPQPLAYLLAETGSRHGTLRVGSVVDLSSVGDATILGAVSYIRSDDANLIGIVAADQRLGPLSLRRSGPYRLVSTFDSDVIFWSLSDARYPVAAEGPTGEIVQVVRRKQPVATTVSADPAEAIIARLRLAKDRAPETGRAWLERQLEVAIRAKLTVTITVAMPNGNLEYLVEPTGLAGGRLRALDRKADIERTLPLASITEVRATL